MYTVSYVRAVRAMPHCRHIPAGRANRRIYHQASAAATVLVRYYSYKICCYSYEYEYGTRTYAAAGCPVSRAYDYGTVPYCPSILDTAPYPTLR